MISEQKKDKALKAIHDLIIKARILTSEHIPNEKMFEFLDSVEYLPALMMESNNKTEFFQEYLKEICVRYDCIYIYENYIN